jgi:lipopolysaccharide transport system ATP-binding protein
MSSTAIDVHSLSKQYDLGESNLMNFLRVRSLNEKFWALRDVSFEIREHEAVGIIGSNGAGKSTLLKILSRVTAPTQGRARIRGRMGTILEVGTGFHPELTGRENIYLSGTILGMRKSEIDRRFDEIVDFAGVDKFVDTPVKRYSSGMYVRLAFAVAAHLDPDILIVDEVLAVGDVSFQKKCLAKMDSSINQDGRTIVFVSHNMQAIRSLCSRALLLERGSLVADGPVGEVLTRYSAGLAASLELKSVAVANRLNRARGYVRVSDVSVSGSNGDGEQRWSFKPGETLRLSIGYEVFERIESLGLSLSFSSAGSDDILTNIRQIASRTAIDQGRSGKITLTIPNLPLRPGEFSLSVALGNADFSIVEDLLDTNVGLPHLTIDGSDGMDQFGVFSLASSIENELIPNERGLTYHRETRT